MAQPKGWDQAAARLGLIYEPGGWTRRHRISGTLDGLAVEVVNSDQEYGDSTDYRVSFPSLGLPGLSLRRGRRLEPTRLFRGRGASPATGNPEFDRAVIVKGADPTRVALFLDARRQALLLRLFEEYRGMRVTDEQIRWSSNRLDPPERLEAGVRALVQAAARLRR